MVTFDRKDLAKYPFLKEAQDYIDSIFSSLDVFLDSKQGKQALKQSILNIEHALDFSGKKTIVLPPIPLDTESAIISIASYPVERILISCAHSKPLTDRLVRYQASVFYSYLEEEEPEIKRYIRHSIGLPEKGDNIPIIDYIPIASRMQDNKWRLINRVVEEGSVLIHPGEYDDIIRERLRYVMSSNLPLKVPGSICERLKPVVEELLALWQKHALEEFGSVEESAFPPCIRAILGAITGQGHLTHMARFAVTAFLHNIGMENTRIVELYGNVPNFDLRKTLYQVEHISGRGGTSVEYSSPLCATMRTHGVCVHPDILCSKIIHPLSYYKLKKRELSREKERERNDIKKDASNPDINTQEK
jgi:DNA primase large subunit